MFSGVEAQKQRVFVIETPQQVNIRSFVEVLCSRLPELKVRQFSIKEKKEMANYGPSGRQSIGGHKVILRRLNIDRITPGRFQVSVEYERPVFRPFLFLFVLLGLIFGLLPGLIIWLAFRESEADEVKKVTPALSRFETVMRDTFITDSPIDAEPVSPLPVEPPAQVSAIEVPTSITDRLKRLDGILAAGAITESEHQQQRARILAEI